jgi:putative nucleotidyltransferase with HDIG domain/excisionase family DNA binding protein
MTEETPREKRVLTIKEVADMLKVSVQTVKNYIYNGKIKSFKTPGGHHRILESEVNKQLDPAFEQKAQPGDTGDDESKRDQQELMDVSALIVRAMVRAIEGKENPLYLGHSDRVAKWSKMIAQSMGLRDDKVELLRMAGLLHDLGKINIDDNILGKEGTLSGTEYAEMKKHPQFGEEIVKDVDFLQAFAPIIRHHHEWYNGSGYPDGLKGGEIPLDAQIIGVAEAYDIISSKYKMNKDPDYIQKSIAELQKAENIQFSSNLVSIMKTIALESV